MHDPHRPVGSASAAEDHVTAQVRDGAKVRVPGRVVKSTGPTATPGLQTGATATMQEHT
jgi:hypothetical protein